ncbi:MAG: DNA mismatch repair protein MutS [Deltaproteobacteria bacterium]|nr:DNA mismatch repair protein MutS [Deltaproteobacteria bacterium]
MVLVFLPMENNSNHSNASADLIPQNLTPMLAQYLEVKRQYPDAIVFYRLGDFYEMFFEDAVKAAPVLEVQLTSRDKNATHPIPMCGIPYHAASNYLQKLLSKGFKVAICEQVEDPKTTKGIVKREVVRVVTPALIGDPDLIAEDSYNYLMTLESIDFEQIEVVLLDLLSGQIKQGTITTSSELTDLIFKYSPKEILLPKTLLNSPIFSQSIKLFPLVTLTYRDSFFVESSAQGSICLSALKAYLKETQKIDSLTFLNNPVSLFDDASMILDSTTLRSLEVLRGLADEDSPSLFKCINYTQTPMGRRTLKEWLTRPSRELALIEDRQKAVEIFLKSQQTQEKLQNQLSAIRDLERLSTKTVLGLAMPRDLVGIRSVLQQIPIIQQSLKELKAPLFKKFIKILNPLEALTTKLEMALEDFPPATLRDGGIFKSGFSEEIAELRELSQDAKGTIAKIEVRERERTGISSLKVKYSKVFGYTIEVTKTHLAKIPSEYIRKQTIANGERFITEELKNFEEKVFSSETRLRSLEETLFFQLRKEVAQHSQALLQNARILGELDVLLGFAILAQRRGYTKPKISTDWALRIVEGKHPVIESLLPAGTFVPNSIFFSEEDCRTLIITGPNMAGKSTIMRQVALIVLLAHIGCFVPAKAADIPLVDAIYTRIGSSDDLSRGRSTFMVEMTETTRILEMATSRSLILIDEIGRGTSTYDGLSLAWSLVEHFHTEVRAKTLFATHFHEVTSLEKSYSQLKNANVRVEKFKNEIIFLYQLSPGICSQSYGIEVAKLASLPSKVLIRAKEILTVLETQSQQGNRARINALITIQDHLTHHEETRSPKSLTCIENTTN